jgi:AP-1 complex subunit sigma 1/2
MATFVSGAFSTVMCDALTARVTDTKVVYRRYASLFFVCGVSSGDNELVTLEVIHRYVEVLDRYFGNMSPACCASHMNC